MTTTLRETKSGWSARIRMGSVGDKAQRPWLPMPPMKAAEAESRHERLQRLATEFVRADKAAEAERSLRICAEQPTLKAFEVAERAARRSLTEAVDVKPSGPRTFRDVAELWLNGDLCRRYPDDGYCVSAERAKRVRAHLVTIYPKLGHLPVTEITRELAERVRAEMAIGRRQGTRRHYAMAIHRVLELAVEPLRLIAQSPVPPKFVPPQGPSRTRAFLFPREERALVSAPAVPWAYRFYYGFLARNGVRKEEGLSLTYGDIDFDMGLITLDKNKTRRPRFWRLAPDVLAALERARGAAKPTALVFEGVKRVNLATVFREHLELAGARRPQLSARSNERRPIVLHDLRSTFVTLSLASGRNETWVMDRTGHTTSAMLNRYRRQARQLEELPESERWLAPLDECLWPMPGLAKVDQSMDQKRKMRPEMALKADTASSGPGLSGRSHEPNLAAASDSNGTGQRLGPPSEGGVDQRNGRGVTADVTSPVTPPRLTPPMLQELLELASRGKRWHLVTALADELEALAEARGGNVVQLDPRRRK